MHIMRPVAGRIRPNTRESGILSTKRKRPPKTSRLTRMLVPKPKKAFQSPGVHMAGLLLVVMSVAPLAYAVACETWLMADAGSLKAARMRAELETQPKIPPCALIMRSPTSWNSGKYDAQQSPGTMH